MITRKVLTQLLKNTPMLIAECLILRRFTESDAKALFSILSDKGVNTYFSMFSLKTIDEAEKTEIPYITATMI